MAIKEIGFWTKNYNYIGFAMRFMVQRKYKYKHIV